MLLGAGRLTIAVILSGSASIPLALTTFPRNLIFGALKMHLLTLSVTPAADWWSKTVFNLPV